MRTILYHVTFAPNRKTNLLHIGPSEFFIARVAAKDDPETFRSYHLDSGKHLVPDYKAIREAIPHQHRKAYDKSGWWFPATLRSALSGTLDQKNACSCTLYSSKGQLLGTLYATPFLAER